MVKKKSIDQMSAEELFELAKARQEQEQEKEREAVKEQIDALREERKALVAQQRKELAALDSKIRKLRGKPVATGKGRGGVNVSKAVLDILAANTQLSTKEIQTQLASNGIVANNLSQTLAYLKRQGKITSPQRSVYAIS